MKILITAIFFFSLVPVMVFAQNSVTVKQKGNGNSVSINQSGSKDRTKTDDCFEELTKKDNKNIIVVKKPGESDTLFTAKDKQFYLLLNVLNSKTKFQAFQKGFKNGLYVLLPDIQSALSYLETKQRGKKNMAVVQLKESPSNVSISQKGGANTVVLNPCSSNGTNQ